VIWQLPQHQCSHAYKRGASIVTNAQSHVNKRFVANVDIENFFPSIPPYAIADVLETSGLGPRLASAIARLTTLRGGLPQGAPTSPTLSNAFLFDVDENMSRYCDATGLAYSRYADDITFSGDNRNLIVGAINKLRGVLAQKGLQLNEKKTRIASRGGQQRVTGVVVNERAQPPREMRRRVRAMLHQATLNPDEARIRLPILRGYVSYLNSFPALRKSEALERYRAILVALNKST
jgi:retron-type reverse transcriptase